MASHGVCTAKVSSLSTLGSFQDVHISFRFEIPGEQACVGGRGGRSVGGSFYSKNTILR